MKEQLLCASLNASNILIEPQSKNTAAAILAGTIYAMKKHEDPVIRVAPCDHKIDNKEAFHTAINRGIPEVLNGNIVAFGITPTEPETGFGYLRVENVKKTSPMSIERFIEKPSKSFAKKLLKEGNYLWNAGIYLFRAKTMFEAFKRVKNNNFSSNFS